MNNEIKDLTSFSSHIDKKYGEKGVPKRDAYEERVKNIIIAEMIREERLEAKLTQEQLAQRIGAKKSYISRVENGKADIQLSTLFRLVEKGFGKKLNLSFG